ncbi:MAG: M48 family metallopeptidase [Patescibacteria group bacterium]
MYSEITHNKRKTWFLIIVMSTVVVGLSWLVGAMNGVDAGTSIIIGTIVATIYSLVSYYSSDSIALSVSGAKRIEKRDSPDLYNLVENLCIANGQTMPAVYIIDDPSPNAFATGRDPEHASIAFTTGIIRILSREELEGVTAHELSHVKNYDIRVMTIVVVLVGLIALIADVMLHLRFRGSRENNNGAAVFMIVGIILAILSPIVAQIIQLAVSRSREYLADASGALLTRYPEGLASALEKISANGVPMRDPNHATAHLFISNPFGATTKTRSFFNNLFSTHPPIDERVAKLRAMGR